jgi:lysophospholipase L1-like esterase
MNWETYIAFGDSITIGARTYLGYPELVGNMLSVQLSKQWNVINHSVSGFKTIDLARYIDSHFSSLKEQNASITSILIGTNDIKEQTQVEDFRIALNQVILKTKLLTINKNVVIFAIPEFHKGIMYPYSIAMNATISTFNETIRELAQQHGIRMVELSHSEQDFLDGVHLNRSGIEHFSTQISKYILKDKGILLG